MLSNSNKRLKKIMVSLLVVTLTYSNFVLVGSNLYKGLISYALDETKLNNTQEIVIQAENEEDNEAFCEIELDSKDIHKTNMKDVTEFTEKLNFKIKNVKDILVEDVTTTFYDNEEQETENAKLKYVKTLLDKEELENVLGEDGTFKVLDEKENTLAEISLTTIEELETEIEENKEDENASPINMPQVFTKTIEVENDEGEVEEKEVEETRSYITISEDTINIIYEVEVNKIKFSLENIKTEQDINSEDEIAQDEIENEEENENGVINFVIENTKSIFDVQDLENLNYLKENINYTFKEEIAEENNEEAVQEEQGNIEQEDEAEEPKIQNVIKFKDTITRARLETDNNEMILGESNLVNYSIILDTMSEKTELYKDPVFILELPESVESINDKNSGFTVENDEGVIDLEESKVTIIPLAGKEYVVVQLKGEQTEESISNGNTIINLSLDLNVEDGEEEIQKTKLYYKNNTVTAYESGLGFDTDEVNVSLVKASESENLNNTINEKTDDNTEQEQNSENINYNSTSYMEVGLNTNNEQNIVRVGEDFEYIVYIYNDDTLNNAILEDTIPNGLEYVNAKIFGYNEEDNDYSKEIDGEINYNTNTRVLSLSNIGAIREGVIVLKIKVKATNMKEGKHTTIINNLVEIKQDEKIIDSKNSEITVSEAFLETSVNDINEKTKVEEVVKYEMVIKNLGLFSSEEKTIKINIPEELEATMISIHRNNNDSISGIPMEKNEKEITLIVDAEDTVTITITAIYNKAAEKNTIVTATAKIDGEEYEWTTKLLRVGNYGENVEEDEDESNLDNPTDPTDPVDPHNPIDPIDPTDPINPDNPVDPKNPNNPDEENTEKPEFDLSLTQNLKKITVTNGEGTTTYKYDNANFAKVEIHSKQMNGSLVTIEYEITIKNEGSIAGYARKIVDYLPNEVEFNSELNKDWFVGDDGNLYSVAFIDTLLQPEDTKTLKLVLTKKMTDNNTGIVTNIAEICEATNEADADDINSTPGDKKEEQNDMAKVEVLITVSTGTIVLYTILTMVVLAILGFGIFKVKNITLKREVR